MSADEHGNLPSCPVSVSRERSIHPVQHQSSWLGGPLTSRTPIFAKPGSNPNTHEGTQKAQLEGWIQAKHQNITLCARGRLGSGLRLWYREPLLREVSEGGLVCLATINVPSLLRLPRPGLNVPGVYGDVRERLCQVLQVRAGKALRTRITP